MKKQKAYFLLKICGQGSPGVLFAGMSCISFYELIVSGKSDRIILDQVFGSEGGFKSFPKNCSNGRRLKKLSKPAFRYKGG